MLRYYRSPPRTSIRPICPMNSHIAITVQKNGKQYPLNLPDDFSIDIDDQNPLFNDNEMFSYPVQMPMEGNRFLLGNIDDPNNIDRPVSLEHTKMRIVVDNQPFRSGTLVTSEDEEIDGALTMNISASEHSIEDLIGSLTCRDIPLKDKILIGEKIGDVKASVEYQYSVTLKFEGKKGDKTEYPAAHSTQVAVFTPQALGFSCPGRCATISGTKDKAQYKETVNFGDGNTVVKPVITESYINVSEPYPNKPYCNARIAYLHHGIDDDGKTTDTASPRDKQLGPYDHWPYWVLEADRQQSGICIYVLYFLDCLFAHLGVHFDNSELLAVEDMRHLCFFTTHCKYDEVYKYDNGYWDKATHTQTISTAQFEAMSGQQQAAYERKPYFTNVNDVNDWLESRGCGGQFEFSKGKSLQVQDVDYTDKNGRRWIFTVGDNVLFGGKVVAIQGNVLSHSEKFYADVMLMYANSDNLPEESVQTVLDSLFNSFGIKFDYNYEAKTVRAYFVRNVFRSTEAPIDFPGRVISMHKIAEKITGVRVCYSEEADSKEQKQNIKDGKRDYNTDYDYIDYPEESTITDKTYNEIFRTPKQQGASTNMTCYIDKTTGNAYRIKVNGDAETAGEWNPALFEVGQFKGVEIGDCSELNEDFVEELASDFQPVPFNDVNYQTEISYADGEVSDPNYGTVKVNTKRAEPILAAYVDEDFEHEFIEQRIRQTITSEIVEFAVDEVLKLVENYDPSDTEDGNSPLQEVDWGLAIAMMRGGGTNATLQEYDYGYDGFNNSKWRTVAGVYALTSDSLDMRGNEYDYNGDHEGIGSGERFSLKIRSWKQPEWADEPLVNADIINPQTGEIEKKIKSRGLFDTFLSEYANFLLKRRKYRICIECSAAQVASVPEHWARRFRINGMVGFINKLSYNVSAAEGLNNLEVEFFVL